MPYLGKGWWGFAALNDADFKIKNDGQDKDVELGSRALDRIRQSVI